MWGKPINDNYFVISDEYKIEKFDIDTVDKIFDIIFIKINNSFYKFLTSTKHIDLVYLVMSFDNL